MASSKNATSVLNPARVSVTGPSTWWSAMDDTTPVTREVYWPAARRPPAQNWSVAGKYFAIRSS